MTLINELLEKAEKGIDRKNSFIVRASHPTCSSSSDHLSDTFSKVFNFISGIQDRPVPVQIGIGSAVGWVTGYVFTKGSKIVAGVLGCSLILLQFSNFRGYIKFNQSKLRRDIEQFRKDITRMAGNRNTISENDMSDFLRNNIYLLSSYTAGFLLGYTFA